MLLAHHLLAYYEMLQRDTQRFADGLARIDVNPLAVELARLGLWITTFVPGLPMSSLDQGLVCAESLTGVGTLDEALAVAEGLVGAAVGRRDYLLATLGTGVGSGRT